MAEDKKISELNQLTISDLSDQLVIVDDSETNEDIKTKHILLNDFFGSPTPIGSITPSTGSFTTLTLPLSPTVTRFSTDVTLSSGSNEYIPTELAVKTYIDSLSLQSNKIFEGDTTAICYDDTAVKAFKVILATVDDINDETSSSYFDSYSASDLTDPDYLADGTTNTYAYAPDSAGVYTHTTSTNTSGTEDLGDILAVRIRVFGYYITGATLGSINIEPVFNGIVSGVTHAITGLPADVGDYSNWIDLTEATGAPPTWSWSDVNNLDVILRATTFDFGYRLSLIEIEVQYSPPLPTIDMLTVDRDGVTLAYGSKVNEISNDATLADESPYALVTEYAVKNYIEFESMNVRFIDSDTTAVTNDIIFVDSTASDVNIQVINTDKSKVRIKKISDDTNNVVVTSNVGLIDGQASFTITNQYETYNFFGNSTNIYIL